MKRITTQVTTFFAVVGIVLSTLIVYVLLRPEVLEKVGFREVSSDLYSCMTYKDPVILEQMYGGEINLKEAREKADARSDIADAYTECLENIFGNHTVWVNTHRYIIYD